jgi:hypothetical protein
MERERERLRGMEREMRERERLREMEGERIETGKD